MIESIILGRYGSAIKWAQTQFLIANRLCGSWELDAALHAMVVAQYNLARIHYAIVSFVTVFGHNFLHVTNVSSG